LYLSSQKYFEIAESFPLSFLSKSDIFLSNCCNLLAVWLLQHLDRRFEPNKSSSASLHFAYLKLLFLNVSIQIHFCWSSSFPVLI